MAIVHIQPALPAYRLDFFGRLAEHYGPQMRVHYSPQQMGTLTAARPQAPWAVPIGPMRHPLRGVEWQSGTLSVPIRRGDTVVVCGAPRNLALFAVLARARLAGARTVWWGQYWSATSTAGRHRLRMRLSRMADALLFYTDAEVQKYRADGWTHAGPVGALNNGLDQTEIRRLRQPYDPAARGQELLFIGRLTDKANLGLLIGALALPGLGGVHLHVIGDGAAEGALRARADAAGLGGRITWHGGTTDEERIAAVANRCAAFVYPGQVGLSLIHGMAYGLPCVVHDQPLRHMPEIAAFADGQTGAAFAEGSAEALAQALAALLAAPERRRQMAEACLAVTASDYSTESMAARFIDFIDRLPPRR